MKIWILSDVHVELTSGWDLPGPAERPDFDVLVMAGDLTPGMDRGVKWLRERVTDRPVIYIPGNHEGYGRDIDRTVEKAKKAAAGSNVLVLQNEATVIAGVKFVCATMWTDFALFGAQQEAMDVAQYRMNDFKRIRTAYYSRRLLAVDTLRRHRASRKFIERELALPFAGPRVVVTHHGPHRDARRPGSEWDFISAAYTSDLEDLIMVGRPNAWIYGHVHISDDRMIGDTRVVSNSKGYGPYRPMGLRTWDNPNFDPLCVIEV
jgi:Icc-related predicted phosphoesterase